MPCAHYCLLGWLVFISAFGRESAIQKPRNRKPKHTASPIGNRSTPNQKLGPIPNQNPISPENLTGRLPKWLNSISGGREHVVGTTEAVESCALEYCRFYPDVSSRESSNRRERCIPENVKQYQKHWLSYGQYNHRYRCGNYTKICGAIWRGDFARPTSNRSRPRRIDIVVAYCKEDMGWLRKFVTTVSTWSHVKKVTIISKCSADMDKSLLVGYKTKLEESLNTSVIEIENRGRNDHTYVYYILNQVLDDEELDDDAVILFIKAGMITAIHQTHGFTRASTLLPTDYVVKVASKTGFACFIEHYPSSMYHNGSDLFKFERSEYYGAGGKKAPLFKSSFSNFTAWLAWSHAQAHAIFPQHMQIVPVCYEGNFAARVGNIRRQRRAWKHFQAILRRGDNIEEGHFMERTWAMILKDDPGDILFEIPHHAAYVSMSYNATPGRFVRCLPQYQTVAPFAVEGVENQSNDMP